MRKIEEVLRLHARGLSTRRISLATGVSKTTFVDAILDRLVHNAYRIALDGPSLRKSDAASERDTATETEE